LAAPAPEKKPAPQDDSYEMFKALADTIDQVERNYVKPVERRELFEAAIQGILSKLDPHSAYINPEELGQFRASVENEFGGVGIQISLDGGTLLVVSPLYGTPAYRAGIVPGDRITEIEGQSTEGITIDKAMQKLKGTPGSKVTVKVLHADASEPKKVTLTRELVHVETVLGDHRLPNDQWDYLLDPDKRIAYIRLTAFSRDTARDLRRALEELQASKPRGLILDLRFNPGGLLTSAIEVSDLFISKGRIVSTSGRNSPERSWDAQAEGTFAGFAMVVLVNRYSASASEIVSACLQDHHRAVVIGERTWGKGSVQNVIELEEGRSLLKLTTSSYLRPNGHNIHRFPNAKESDEWGVRPDKGYELKLDDEEMVALVRDRRDRDILHPHRAQTKASPKPLAAVAAKSSPTKPAEKTKPVVDKAKPAAEKAAPVVDKNKPAVEKAKPVVDKAQPTKPAAKPNAGQLAHKPAAAKKPQHAQPFVDRQLQMGIDYLNAEFVRASVK
jgi:carboxyl-terminal processing protease